MRSSAKKICVFERGVQNEFPDFQHLKDMNIEGYFGVPLFDSPNKPLGLLSVMNRRALDNPNKAVDLLNIFDIRVSAGLQRLRAEDKIKNALTEAEHANQTKSAFLATMSHELRTPLNAIIGFSQVITEQIYCKIEEERYCEYAQDIYNSGHHLLSLINDLLYMSKIESGKLEPDGLDINIADEIMGNFKLVEGMARKKDISLNANLTGHSLTLHADPRMFQQIFTNLLSNAVKFTEADGSVTVSDRIAANGDLELEIADTGMGISSLGLKSVMEPFEQARNQKSNAHGGTGLGLPIARS
jgi:two-component system cell cycle sensor histidine kinase PleC